MNYPDYISSARWRQSAARLGELETSGFRCRTCFAPSSDGTALEVHHRTYARLGCELVGDLATLCSTCHRLITDMLRRRRYERLTPLVVDVVPAIENPPPLFDPGAHGAMS